MAKLAVIVAEPVRVTVVDVLAALPKAAFPAGSAVQLTKW